MEVRAETTSNFFSRSICLFAYFSDFSDAIMSDNLTSSDHCGSDQGDGEAISVN